jgi:hypothetical protein
MDASNDLGANDKPAESFWYNNSDNVDIRNSALNYLVINNEWERADMLRKFITLLSNINTHSPWYFKSISGLDEALNRTEFGAEQFSIPEVKTLTITCMPDAYDNRIGTLLDLYRAICYSYSLHKEIVPANLRKFNMYIYIFNAAIRHMHGDVPVTQNTIPSQNIASNAVYGQEGIEHHIVDQNVGISNSNTYITSSKLIELRDCELDVNSSKSGYGNITNEEGFQQEYSIGIKYNACYEQRYNEILLRTIGDFVIADKDLPGATGEKSQSGILPNIVWNSDDAAKRAMVAQSNSRIDNFDSGKNNEQDVSEAGGDIGNKIYVNQNTTSGQDKWSQMGSLGSADNSAQSKFEKLVSDKVNDVSRSVDNIINTGRDAINSYTDVSRLQNSIYNAIESLTYGNIFELSLTQRMDNIASTIGNLSSSRVLSNAASNIDMPGWTHI